MRCDDVAASILGTLTGAAVAQRATQNTGCFVVHKARVAHTVAARVSRTVVALAGIGGAHAQGCLGDGTNGCGRVSDGVITHHVSVVAINNGVARLDCQHAVAGSHHVL